MFTSVFNGQRAAFVALLSGLLLLDACRPTTVDQVTNRPSNAQARVAPDAPVYLLTDNNRLLLINPVNTTNVVSTVTISGITVGDVLVAIDFRPATGQLYGVSRGSRLYVINPLTGVARALGTGSFTPALTGDVTAFDFNPVVDRIRVVTNAGLNLRLNPETGAVQAVDGSINGAPNARPTGAAYLNNRAGTTTTTLFILDPVNDKLYRQEPPNNGTLVEVGSLGVDAAGVGSFDIAPDGNTLAALIVNNQPGLYDIDLTTGGATKLGNLPNVGMSIVGLAMPTEPVAYAIDNANNLVIFNPQAPQPVTRTITGLQSGEQVLALDFRPANGQLYALGSTSRLYTINTANGAATAVGTGPFSPALASVDVGFDFNPVVDAIRVVSGSQNLRLGADTGLVLADPALNPGSPSVTAAAYTNNFAGATTTVLYDLDSQSDRLLQQSVPNAGTLVDVGPLGINIEGATGFDIGGTSGTAFALLRTTGPTTRLYRINLATGAATPISDFPVSVRALAVGLGF